MFTFVAWKLEGNRLWHFSLRQGIGIAMVSPMTDYLGAYKLQLPQCKEYDNSVLDRGLMIL